jgi:hypothetical protein
LHSVSSAFVDVPSVPPPGSGIVTRPIACEALESMLIAPKPWCVAAATACRSATVVLNAGEVVFLLMVDHRRARLPPERRLDAIDRFDRGGAGRVCMPNDAVWICGVGIASATSLVTASVAEATGRRRTGVSTLPQMRPSPTGPRDRLRNGTRPLLDAAPKLVEHSV